MKPVLPGSIIGVLGSGQLGRMFAIAARRMGYRVHTFSPDSDTPTGQVSDLEVRGAYEDLDAVRKFARAVSVVTFEFENVPFKTAEAAAEVVPVRPGGLVLHTTQQRLREKSFLRTIGVPVAPFQPVRTEQDLRSAIEFIGTPSIMKTAAFGYDGKGQVHLDSRDSALAAWKQLGGPEAILEARIDFEREISLVVARGVDGSFVHYDVFENHHVNGILDVTSTPARISPALVREAVEIGRIVAERLELVGVLCIEFFVDRNERLLVNELAPRPHNSGHLTFDASVTSQFEQQLRAVCALPLGSTEMLRPAAMANLLGDLWQKGEPGWAAACVNPNLKVHLYGKEEPRPGRKMGHLTVLASNAEDARREVIAARQRL